MAKVLVIGSGGREHAIAYKFKQSKHVDKVFVAPGNPGMCDVATICDINVNDFDGIVKLVKDSDIDLVFVGPEIPLCNGISDVLCANGIRVFGPSKKASQIEGSKVFAKDLMRKYDIPTASYASFNNYEDAKAYLLKQKCPVVIKADGLAAGKGVIIAYTMDEALKSLQDMMCDHLFDEAGSNVVIEEYLEGEEFSLLAFVHNEKVFGMQLAQDHKRAFDNDEGLNTGGMGAYTPVDHISQAAYDEAFEKIMKRCASAMVKEGCPFTGILYGGCMLCEDGVKTIEFNCRFGDPETEVVLLALENDLYEVVNDVMDGKDVDLSFDNNYYLGVVLASKGYPLKYEKDHVIENVDKCSMVFHMGTGVKDGYMVNSGGRVLMVIGKGKTLKEAQNNAYNDVLKIRCDALFYRHDIGNKGIKDE